MSLYVLSDLHLSTSDVTNKSMEVFGNSWNDYMNRIEKYWRAVIDDEDTVIVPGDVSWAMTMEEGLSDFKFIDSLPGRKILGKGNHDFWWSTMTKIKNFFAENEIKTIDILYNNAFAVDEFIVTGTRGWFYDQYKQNVINETDFEKVVARETIRLDMGLTEAKKLEDGMRETIVFMHFPPVWNGFECRPIIDKLHEYNIKRCYFGHIHGNYFVPKVTNFEGIDFILTSADYLKFAPMPIFSDY